jgi:hypothetical protein
MKPFNCLTYLFILLPAPGYALPPEFTATYTAETYGVTVAQATYKLEHKDNGIIFNQRSKPTGFAAFFSDDGLDETSHLSLHQDKLLLDEYRYIQRDAKKNKNVHLKVRWNEISENKISGVVRGKAGSDHIRLKINTPVWDTLSFQIPIMLNIDKNIAPQEYNVLVKGKLKKYMFVTHGTEKISIGDNTIKTIKVERKDDKKGKSLFLWAAPSLHNLPVKIEKWKKGKPHITMLLNSASFPSDKNLQFKAEEDFDDL